MGKRKKTNNDLQNITQKTTDLVTGTPLKLQNITQKTTDRVTENPLKPGVNQAVPAPLVAPVRVTLVTNPVISHK